MQVNILSIGWNLSALAVLIAAFPFFGDASYSQTVSVTYSDIPDRVHIVGKLGQDLGKIVTLHGEWAKSDPSKPPEPIFVVTAVNGFRLKIPAEFAARDVGPVDHANEDFAEKSSDETRELRAVETGGLVGFSDDVWKEIGGPPKARLPEWFYHAVMLFEDKEGRKTS